MLQKSKKTHTEIKTPQMSVSQLADYMAASEQMKRSIIRGCKYRAIARVVQHAEARAVIAEHLLDGAPNAAALAEKAAAIRAKLADTDFEEDVNEHNADYVARFSMVLDQVDLPEGIGLELPSPIGPMTLHGVKLTFRPQLMVKKPTKKNKLLTGAIMLRYAKGKPLAPSIAAYQSSATFGFMRMFDQDKVSEADKALSITLDAYAGRCYAAPKDKAVYFFKEMRAACEAISERWPAIKPPKNAVL